jgi:hypothetical protein
MKQGRINYKVLTQATGLSYMTAFISGLVTQYESGIQKIDTTPKRKKVS